MSNVELQRYFAVIWKWLWLVILATGLAAGTSYYATQSMPRTYVSSTMLMVGESIENLKPSADEITTSQRLAEMYATMAQREPILEATVKALELPMSWLALRQQVLVNYIRGTQLVEIRVTHTDPGQAQRIATGIAEQLILASPTATGLKEQEERRHFIEEQLQMLEARIQQAKAMLTEKQAQLTEETSARAVLERQDEIKALELNIGNWQDTYATLLESNQGRGPNTLAIVDPAFLPTTPSSPNVRAYVLTAALVGLLFALAAAFLIEYLTDVMKSKEDVKRALGLPTLGSIATMRKTANPAGQLVTMAAPWSPAAEAHRALRASVQFCSLDKPLPTLLITSAIPEEGKSTICANLAVAMAQAEKHVLIVDADLYHPFLHDLFGVPNEMGVASLLLNDALHPTDCMVSTGMRNLRLLPAGPLPANATELLGTNRMQQLLQALEAIADVVILDSPPVLAAADVSTLASRAAGTILVVGAGRTRTSACRDALETLRRAHANVLGVALNGVSARSLAYYAYARRGTVSTVMAHPKAVLTRVVEMFRALHKRGGRLFRRNAWWGEDDLRGYRELGSEEPSGQSDGARTKTSRLDTYPAATSSDATSPRA